MTDHYATSEIPRFVTVPKHITMDQAKQALVICRELGLLQDTPTGVMFMTEGIKWSLESGQ